MFQIMIEPIVALEKIDKKLSRLLDELYKVN